MKILHLEPLRYPARLREKLAIAGQVDYLDTTHRKKILETIQTKPYQALFVRLGIAIDEELLNHASNLRYIITPTTGLNHIDLATAKAKDICVISLKGETDFLNNIKSTAEHTWALLLALIRRIPAASSDVLQGNWQRERFLGSELNGKTIGIIGFGRLGRIVARYAQGFDMKILVNDIDPTSLKNLPLGYQSCSLKELLSKSDIISLHIPFNEENKYFFDSSKFKQLKSNSILINTSRGEVIQEEALLEALNNNGIGGAALDVLWDDSSWSSYIPPKHALIQYAKENENLIITPHIGGYAIESIEGTRAFIIEKFLKKIYNASNSNR